VGYEFGYGDLPKQVVAFSIKCEAESVKTWEANDRVVLQLADEVVADVRAAGTLKLTTRQPWTITRAVRT